MPEEPDFATVFAEMEALGFSELPEERPRVAVSPDTRLRDSFREITAFVEANGREPRKGMNVQERALAMRLAEFRENPTKAQAVLDIDPLNLLPHEDAAMDDVLSSLSNLSFEEDIFDVSGLPAPRTKPEYVATRKQCADFENYRQLFARCQEDLWQGRRHIIRVAGHDGAIKNFGVGRYFVVRGVLGYVADAEENTSIQSWQVNRRLRVIFENGTESDLLLRSLFRAMYENGCLISERDEDSLSQMSLGEDEAQTGIVYVLKSKSENPAIQAIPNLYKIGVSTQRLEERIANAEHEPTYLMAKVEPVIHFTCYDLNVTKMENLIHRVFSDAQVVLDVTDDNGRVCHPREWFSVPISVIQQAVQMLVDGSIVNYTYDPTTCRMVERE